MLVSIPAGEHALPGRNWGKNHETLTIFLHSYTTPPLHRLHQCIANNGRACRSYCHHKDSDADFHHHAAHGNVDPGAFGHA